MIRFFAFSLFFCLISCKKEEVGSANRELNLPLFSLLEMNKTNVLFSNDIIENEAFNTFKYEYFYNGAGVSIGDINNDGLSDIYFTGNMVDDKLYLNKGNLEFEDITQNAIGKQAKGWHTGTTFVDVNGDGFLDVYVCRGGDIRNFKDQSNLLYINNGDLTFTEQAHVFGIDDGSNSTQAAFFDYDLDGDLDAYVMNVPNELFQYSMQEYRDMFKSGKNKSDHFYKNDNGKFIEISKSLGINNHAFGLGLCVSDIDNNGYLDIYVSNDYEDRDYLFMNNKGVFTEELKQRTRHISNFGMGIDIADFNNDAHQDIMELDMAYSSHIRSKRNMASMSIDKFWNTVATGNYYQYMSNSLQLNNGNGTFSDIAHLATVAKTDWSWAALFADFDNDGLKDLVITNGQYRDFKDRDFQENLNKQIAEKGKLSLDEVYSFTPSSVQSNFVFKNKGDLSFENNTKSWGFNKKINSNGIAYADLDNDGDLDLVVNNLDKPASIYENNLNGQVNYVAFQLKGNRKNVFAFGAKVKVYTEYGVQTQEISPTRGYLSSVDTKLHFGLGEASLIKKVEIIWPDNKTTILHNLNSNRTHYLSYNKSAFKELTKEKVTPIFKDISQSQPLQYKHTENKFNDWDREILLPYALSSQGPVIAVADVNKNQLEDVFIGGSSGNLSQIRCQKLNGTFISPINSPFIEDIKSEDIGALFFDADNDGDNDLYVCSGGNEFVKNSKHLQDRLYINDGNGNFIKSRNALPKMISSTKVIVSGDIDSDGDLDLFVGGRLTPGEYPKASRSYVLRNDNGNFTDITSQWSKALLFPGMITGAEFTDVNNDGKLDLTLVGEWMGFTQFINDGEKFAKKETDLSTEGLWFSLASGDIDNDGDIDFVAGNLGANSKFKASLKKPFNIYGSDFDKNGSYDLVLSAYEGDKNYPVRGKECSSQQMPSLLEKFPTYKSFAESDMKQLYGSNLDEAHHLTARHLKSSIFINDGNGNFIMKDLPNEAQFSPIMGIELEDINGDNKIDIVAAGNLYEAEVETVRYDAGRGVCLIGDGENNFKPLTPEVSGFFAWNNVKSITKITLDNKKCFILGVNNNFPQIFELK
ncbi:VCBS repeat-containing protein [Lacinutrix jangbogonensis]|uniref:VCBS repeat-containing protein n=1 Tax=Lacinutrix jangbogonensis TaxID=1469557 RepID=UPI00053D49DD|nr:VCBS repeat-containing protein [Lacinutrix jangbogonensis]